MTHQPDHIAHLLDQAPPLPKSADLRQQIMATVMLDAAPKVAPSPGLHQKIMAAAVSQAVNQQDTAEIIKFPAKTTSIGRFFPTALTGGLMAASLLLGIWTGTSNIADSFLAPSFEIAALALDPAETFGAYDYTAGLDLSEEGQ